jgi:hypothetical protein
LPYIDVSYCGPAAAAKGKKQRTGRARSTYIFLKGQRAEDDFLAFVQLAADALRTKHRRRSVGLLRELLSLNRRELRRRVVLQQIGPVFEGAAG